MKYYCFSLIPYHQLAMTLRVFFVKKEKIFGKDLKVLIGDLGKNKELIEKNIVDYFINNIEKTKLVEDFGLNESQARIVKGKFPESFILQSDEVENYLIIKDIIE